MSATSSTAYSLPALRWAWSKAPYWLFAIAVDLCFSSGIGAGYLLDDKTSVMPMQALRDDGSLFWYFVLSDGSGPLGRPISAFTFAIEQLVFSASPSVSQFVSIVFHTLNALIFFEILRCLARVRFGSLSRGTWTLLPLAVAFAWAATPQKVSTVLYIVQRMAILSTLFCLLSMLLYVKARLATVTSVRIWLMIGASASLLLAPFAKETGALAVFFIAALEVFVLSRTSSPGYHRVFFSLALLALLLGLVGFAALGIYEFQNDSVRFAVRNYSFLDRVWTAPAALLDYVSQYFVPDIGRMGLFHDDFPVGSDNPNAVLGIVLLGGVAVFILVAFLLPHVSLVAAGLTIFIIGHSIESFFLPLEIYFEHRNYAPSLGLAIASLGCLGSVYRWAGNEVGGNREGLVSLVVVTVAGALAFATVLLSLTWRSYPSWVQHHVYAHPRSARAHATQLAALAGTGQAEAALEQADLAYELTRSERAARPMGYGDWGLSRASIACMAGLEFAEVLPPASESPQREAPFRSTAVQTLARMARDQVCPSADWTYLSTWVQTLIGTSYSVGVLPKPSIFADLARLEHGLGNHTQMFVYASMGREMAPDNAMFLFQLVEAAMEGQDEIAVKTAIQGLRDFEKEYGFDIGERSLLNSVAPGFLDAKESTDPGGA